ncbi:type II toxin-antitoxin system MqsR family toxin [Mesorhizobium australicum]
MFVKSMTTFADHRVWQSVYHVPARDGLPRNRRNVDARSPSIHRDP